MNGILLIDKPAGQTSHDIVDHVRKAARLQRVGHTGTLDPGATGLLILCLGTATRLSEHLTGLDKVYEGSMRFGIETDSYDLDGRIVVEKPVPDFTMDEMKAIFHDFTGELQQVPPMVSAVKIGGERLYKKARKGEIIEREPRSIVVRELDLLGINFPEITFKICCTRGTYVRSICHDIGQRLGCGAILASLRRTWVGRHSVDQAIVPEKLRDPDDVSRYLLPVEQALNLPEIMIRDSALQIVRHGGKLRPEHVIAKGPVSEGWIQIKTREGHLLALGVVTCGPVEFSIQPKRVLTT